MSLELVTCPACGGSGVCLANDGDYEDPYVRCNGCLGEGCVPVDLDSEEDECPIDINACPHCHRYDCGYMRGADCPVLERLQDEAEAAQEAEIERFSRTQGIDDD